MLAASCSLRDPTRTLSESQPPSWQQWIDCQRSTAVSSTSEWPRRSYDYNHNAARRFLSASAVSLPLMSRFIDIQALALLGSAQIVLNSPGA